MVRDPFGKVCTVGRGTRADCIEGGFKLAGQYAIDAFSMIDNPQDEIHALNGPWRLVLWPPKLDPDPRFWAGSADVFGD
jgi:hypothetical protein